MTKWARNFIDSDQKGVSGKCPCCGSPNTDYIIVQNPAFIEVWCNDCRAFESMCYRGTPPEGRKVMLGDEYKDKNPRLLQCA